MTVTREEALAKLKKLRAAAADADEAVRELIYGQSDRSQRPYEDWLAQLDKAITDLEGEPSSHAPRSWPVTNDDVLAFIEEANELNRMLVSAARGTITQEEKRTLLRYLKAHSGRLQALERHIETLPEDPDLSPSERPDDIPQPGTQS
jgi:hypothetical protein